MRNYSEDFGPFEGTVWINTSHQGALPRMAVESLREAIEWKRSPHYLIDSTLFNRVPQKLRTALGKLINAPAEDIILGNSASYGLHLLANGINWKPGDEVLLVDGDFPATILPWLGLKKRGVQAKFIKPQSGCLRADDVAAGISERTRLLCTSWVFSFTGAKIDVSAVSEVCRSKGVKLVLNASQALGTQPFDVSEGLADAITSVGFKWLCGPYGTGFCWIEPELRESFEYNQAYWLAMQTADDLKSPQSVPRIKDGLGARKYDVFGTANFFNFVPWTASIEYIENIGTARIKEHNDNLVRHLIDRLDQSRYEILSPVELEERSTIVIVSHRDSDKNQPAFNRLQDEKIFVAMRNGCLRFSPHLYNTADEIDRALDILNSL
ncbi:MAG: aminotransferase class V-fold PLP-dependent enzyme [Candidatus Zixiibacteriota bacterium]|nr:MAG: aminotransferase class V-fold PLP-dependent enzyme [candidate division Zixibacteria bacterium]